MSIATALFTDSQARVFRWLFGQPSRSFYLSELRRLTGLGSASLQRELNRLAEAGLVSSQHESNLRRFQANPDSAVYPELISLARKTFGPVPLLQQALLPLAPVLRGAWLFGSVAKQNETAQSDVDVMLVGQNILLSQVLELLLPLEGQLGRKINPVCYTPAEFERRRRELDSFVNRVLAQPVISLMENDYGPVGA
jgi:predicted nucleotidyltransferase